MKLTLAPLHSLHTRNVTNTFWMGCSELEEHLWWIELNALVLSSEDWGWFPLSLVGLVAPVIGLGVSPTWLSLSMVAGVVTLVIGMTGNIDCPFNWLKDE